MRKLAQVLTLTGILLILASCLLSKNSEAQNERTILDKPQSDVVGLFAYENPIRDTQNDFDLTVISIYGRYGYRYTHLNRGAWRWDSGTISLTPFHTYRRIPSAYDAQQIIAALYKLEKIETVEWNSETGFATTVGQAGLAVPRLELVLYYKDGNVRDMMIGQIINGEVYGLVFDGYAGENIHPQGLYKLGSDGAVALLFLGGW